MLNDALAFRDKSTIELRNFFDSINFKLFDKIFSEFTTEEPHFIIFYILFAYSEDSPWLIIGADWKEEKTMIAERLNIPDYIRPWCIEMLDNNVRSAIVDYIDFQSKPDFKSLQLKQIQYDKITSAIVKQMSADEDGSVNLGNLFEANKELDKLKISIDKLVEDLRKKYVFKFIAEEELIVAEQKTANKLSGGIENSRWISK